MRVFLGAVLLVCLVSATLTTAQGTGGDASKVLAAARQALGGEDKLAAVKSFVATGRTRQIRGNNLVPIEFEIACELPDKYVRRDEIPAQETGVTSAGFNADALIQIPAPPEPPPQTAKPAVVPAGGAAPTGAAAAAKPVPAAGATTTGAPTAGAPAATGASTGATPLPPGATATAAPSGRAGGPPAPPPDPRKARVTTLKQDFVRLTLGMFATSFSSYPLTFTLDGVAEAPQGKADIVDVKGPGTFVARLFIAEDTHLPIMVSWTTPATINNIVMVVPGQPVPENLPPGSIKVDAPPPPAPTAPKEEQAKYAKDVQELRMKTLKSAKPVEYRVYYADYRDVGNGIKFPFRLRRAIAGETVEETNFDNFKINGRIDPRKFEVVK